MTAHGAVTIAAIAAGLVSSAIAGVRWLRVAQREHYLPGSATRFALRWWLGFGPNRLLGAAAVVGVILSPVSPVAALGAATAIAVGPFRLSLRGRAPGKLAWTPRLRRVAVTSGALVIMPVAAGSFLGAGAPLAVLMALLAPVVVDVACALMGPVEDHLASRFVALAVARLREVAPTVVAITGSYGKTSTKVYVAHLCAPARRVVPTPASFNNRAGLSRAINENLVPGTELFVAEMGTYGRGEIRSLCQWCSPSISAITAIGPVHLERFGSEDKIVEAKSEIFDTASVAVLNIDDSRLAEVADAQASIGRRVWRCSSIDDAADVCVRRDGAELTVAWRGTPMATVTNAAAQASNVAIAVAIALEVGVAPEVIVESLATLPSVPSRQAVTTLSTGATALDDTFNSNPAGCRAALAALARLATPGGQRVVVTPGMVELGPRQAYENAAFGAAVAGVATQVILIGSTNRRSLLAGLASVDVQPPVLLVDHRDQAVDWVRSHTTARDVVLYENDLPDHYP